jgi:hypothetical protein
VESDDKKLYEEIRLLSDKSSYNGPLPDREFFEHYIKSDPKVLEEMQIILRLQSNYREELLSKLEKDVKLASRSKFLEKISLLLFTLAGLVLLAYLIFNGFTEAASLYATLQVIPVGITFLAFFVKAKINKKHKKDMISGKEEVG